MTDRQWAQRSHPPEQRARAAHRAEKRAMLLACGLAGAVVQGSAIVVEAAFVNPAIGTTFIPLWLFVVLGAGLGLVVGVLRGVLAVGATVVFRLTGQIPAVAASCGLGTATMRLCYVGVSGENLAAALVQGLLIGGAAAGCFAIGGMRARARQATQ
jgi:hypothetical protein